MNWTECDIEDVDKSVDLSRDRHTAYCNVFLESENGKRVLYDLMQEAYTFDADIVPVEDAQMFLILNTFIAKIKRKCGITPNSELFNAYESIGKKVIFKEKAKEKTDD